MAKETQQKPFKIQRRYHGTIATSWDWGAKPPAGSTNGMACCERSRIVADNSDVPSMRCVSVRKSANGDRMNNYFRKAFLAAQTTGSKVTLVATPPQLVKEGVLRPFPSTPTQFQVDNTISSGCAYDQS